STSTKSRDPNHLGVSAKRNSSDHRAGLVGRDGDVDALEFLEVEVAGGGQGPTQGTDEVEFADRGATGSEEHLFEAADGAQFHSVAARQLGVVSLGAPMHTAAGSLGRPGQGGAEHDGIGADSEGLDDLAAGTEPAVGDDVDVATAGFVHVVAPCRVDIGD